mgnify:FL=1
MIKHNTSNNRIAVVFLAATFAVALYSVVIEVLSALQISFFAADDRVGLPIFTFLLPFISVALYLRLRYVSLHPLSNPQPNGPEETEENKWLLSRYADKMLPNITGMMLVLAVEDVVLMPDLIIAVLFWAFYMAVVTMQVFSKITYKKR